MASCATTAAVLAAFVAWFALRARDVGLLDAVADMLGVSRLPAYIRWRDEYWPLHPELFQKTLRPEWLDPALAAALSNTTGRREALRALAVHEGLGVFTFPLFTRSFCQKLAEETARFEASGLRVKAPNSMNDYGVALEELGLDDIMLQLRKEVLVPLADAFYKGPPWPWALASSQKETPADADAALGDAELGDAVVVDAALGDAALLDALAEATGLRECCDEHHAFTVRYEASGQSGLDKHHDESDITLNVCLLAGDELEGSELNFCGFAGHPEHRQHRFSLQHRVGNAVMHLGLHRHGVEDVLAGTRQNLILWGRTRDRGHRQDRLEQLLRTRPLGKTLEPDLRCLSWTHDADFTTYRELPPAALKKQRERDEAELLLKYVRSANEEQISMLPADHQPIVRMLKAMVDAEQNGGGVDQT